MKLHAAVLIPLLVTLTGCDAATPSESRNSRDPHALVVADGSQQEGLTGMALEVPPTVMVVDRSGRGVAGVPVQFYVSSGGGWISSTEPVITDEQGRASVDWYMGPRAFGDHVLGASSPVGGTGMRAYPRPLTPGVTYTSRSGQIEYTHGELPLILGAPHGGVRAPAAVPDRASAAAGDPDTQALLRTLQDVLRTTSGRTPFTVISHLDRRKMDPEQALVPGAGADAMAQRAWREYHGLLATARAAVEDDHERGLYVAMQPAGRADGPVDIGYLLTAADLAQPDDVLDHTTWLSRTSIRALVSYNHPAFTQILRGGMSLGERFTLAGVPAVPNASVPAPPADSYVGASYSIDVHGSRDRGLVSAILLRTPASLHDGPQARSAFAATFVEVMEDYFTAFYRASLLDS